MKDKTLSNKKQQKLEKNYALQGDQDITISITIHHIYCLILNELFIGSAFKGWLFLSYPIWKGSKVQPSVLLLLHKILHFLLSVLCIILFYYKRKDVYIHVNNVSLIISSTLMWFLLRLEEMQQNIYFIPLNRNVRGRENQIGLKKCSSNCTSNKLAPAFSLLPVLSCKRNKQMALGLGDKDTLMSVPAFHYPYSGCFYIKDVYIKDCKDTWRTGAKHLTFGNRAV